MDNKSNGCTGFFNTWIKWGKDLRVEKIEIKKLCDEHDKKCSSTKFLKSLWKNRVVFGIIIGLVASLLCWVKYPKYMWRRL